MGRRMLPTDFHRCCRPSLTFSRDVACCAGAEDVFVENGRQRVQPACRRQLLGQLRALLVFQ